MYPSWFPYPGSWLRAIAALLFTALLGFALTITGAWAIVAPFNGYEYLLAIFGAAGFTALVVCFLHHIFLGKSPQRMPWWVPSWRSIRAALTMLIVIVVATAIASGLVFPFLRCFRVLDELECANEDKVMRWFFALWITVAAYLYQYDFLVRRRRERKKGQTG